MHLHAAISGGRNVIQNHRIDIFGVLNVESMLGRIDELSHVVARICIAPQQSFVARRRPITMLPISIENLRYLSHSMWLLCNDTVVARQREVFFREIEG